MSAANLDKPLKMVKCPQCAGRSVYASSNLFRPFCSERCQQIDLGAWASERFALPAQVLPDEDLSGQHLSH